MAADPIQARDLSASGDPLAEITRIVTRTLWILFGGFCLAPVGYLVVLLALNPSADEGFAGLAGGVPGHWDQWQFFFAVAGIVCIYASFRLRRFLLNPARLLERARRGTAATSGPLAHPEMIQELIGRVTLGHVLIWALVEIPSVLGVIDRLISGDSRFFLGLIALTFIGLYAQRPSRAWITGLFADALGRR
jgi:hypothetical protein